MASQMENHLRKYVEDSIQKKVRLTNMIDSYKEQENKSRERAIDETTLEQQMIASNALQEKINLVNERKTLDQQILSNVQDIITKSEDEAVELVNRMSAHLEELSQLEINSGGFVTHVIGVDKNVKYDKETEIISFTNEGHIEIPIAVRLSNWKDSSQLTINKIKKAGA